MARSCWSAAALAVASSIVVGSCGAGSSTVDYGPLAVVDAEAAGGEALIAGTLEITDRCVLLDEQGSPVLLVWPDDRVAWEAETETIAFTGTLGEATMLRDGQEVTFGGGGTSEDEGGLPAEEYIAAIDWIAKPAAECVVGSRWFVADIVAG